MEEYLMQQWCFHEAYGKHAIDLGESNIQCQKLADIGVDLSTVLDYSQDQGSVSLRRAVGNLYRRSIDEIAITNGSQEALYLIYRTLLESGDSVITFRPGWQQSWSVPRSMGCKVTALEYGINHEIDMNSLEKALTAAPKLLVLNTPCNPTGKKLSRKNLLEIVQLLSRHGTYLVCDEEYLIDFNESAVGLYERAISVSSLSKIYGLPGLRTGWLCGPRAIVDAAVNYRRYTSICNSVLCERLAENVLQDRQRHLSRYHRLRTAGFELLKEWAQENSSYIQMVEPAGTPFAWFDLLDGRSSWKFCRQALNAGVLLMPAEVFGSVGGFRLTFAREQAILLDGLLRVESVLRSNRNAHVALAHV